MPVTYALHVLAKDSRTIEQATPGHRKRQARELHGEPLIKAVRVISEMLGGLG